MLSQKFGQKSLLKTSLPKFASLALGICVLGFGASLARAESLTLNRVLGDLASSPRIQKATSMAEETSWKRVESLSGFLPTVSIGASRLLNHEWLLTDVNFGVPVSVPAIQPTTNYTLSANWLLFDGLANVSRWRSARSFEAAAGSELDWARFQSRREIIQLYYRALAAKTLREVAEQNVKVLEDHLNDTKLFKKAGVSTGFDLLRVEVQLSEAQSEVLNAKDTEALGILRLSEVTNKDYSGEVIEGKMPVLDAKIASALDPSRGKRGDLVALESRVRGLDLAASASNGHWFPRVSLFTQYQKYDNRGDQWSGDEFRDAHATGIQLTWTLFDGFGSYARSREAIEERTQSEQSLAQARMSAQTNLELWKRKFAYYSTVYRSRLGDAAKSTESVRLAKEGRKVGSRTNTDLLDAEAELFRAKAGLVNAQLGAIEALIGLELATGQELYQFE